MESGWAGLPYRPISEYYSNIFGGKVYKIPVTVVDDCPNRRGLKGMETCIFCDVWGSAANSESLTMGLREQIEKYQKSIGDRYKAKMFLVYFQAYTNTFAKLDSLKINFSTALSYPFVKGIVIGTRPDCLSPAVFRLWNEYHELSHVSVELGVQSFFDEDLLFMKRGHTAQQSLDAIYKISEKTNVNLGIHLMFGQPSESDETILKTAEICNTLPIQNIKLHNLHVLKNTPLEKLYQSGQFIPIERDEYARRVRLFIENLRPDIYIHRLAAFASRWDELVAPSWTSDKMGTHQFMIDYLRSHQSHQSYSYAPKSPTESQLKAMLTKQASPVAQSLSRI